MEFDLFAFLFLYAAGACKWTLHVYLCIFGDLLTGKCNCTADVLCYGLPSVILYIFAYDAESALLMISLHSICLLFRFRCAPVACVLLMLPMPLLLLRTLNVLQNLRECNVKIGPVNFKHEVSMVFMIIMFDWMPLLLYTISFIVASSADTCHCGRTDKTNNNIKLNCCCSMRWLPRERYFCHCR